MWLRDVLHVVPNDKGEVESLIGLMFDISERKRTEEKRAQLQQELERLSLSDSLTDVGNRRMFDTVMWGTNGRAAAPATPPLSLVMTISSSRTTITTATCRATNA